MTLCNNYKLQKVKNNIISWNEFLIGFRLNVSAPEQLSNYLFNYNHFSLIIK